MIDISLPLFMDQVGFYDKIFRMTRFNPESFYENKIIISSLYGNFYWSYWGGEVNNNYGISTEYDSIEEFDKINKIPITLDLSNINLQEFDLYDRKLNMILNRFHTGANFIAANYFPIINYIKENYPNYRIIFSENAALINDHDIDILNTMLENDEIYEVILGLNTIPRNFLSKINRKDKIRLKICDKCVLDCSSYLQCRYEENNYQYNFSENSIFNNCKKLFNYKDFGRIKKEIKHFQSLGFYKFLIDTPPNTINKTLFNLFIALSFANDDNSDILRGVLFND